MASFKNNLRIYSGSRFKISKNIKARKNDVRLCVYRLMRFSYSLAWKFGQLGVLNENAREEVSIFVLLFPNFLLILRGFVCCLLFTLLRMILLFREIL